MPDNRPSLLATLAQRGWLSLRQFAIIAGVSYPTALKMKTRGAVSTVQVGGVFRVYQDEVERFLKHGNRQTTGEEGVQTPSDPGYKMRPG